MKFYFSDKKSKKTKLITKALTVFPPFILTCLVGSLKVIFDITGIFAFILCFTLPCIFQRLSKDKSKKDRRSKVLTYFSGMHSYDGVIIVVFMASVVLFVVAAFFIIKEVITDFKWTS